jgi:hypothetical protein
MSRRVNRRPLTDAERGARRHADRGRIEHAARALLTTGSWQRWIRVRPTNGLSRCRLLILEPGVSLTGRVAVRVVMARRFINRHLAVPEPVADVVTTNVAKSLRSYFLGVTIIAAFNGVVIGLAALILGVPLAGTIAVVTFVAAYVPFVGAWVAGAFAVLIALGSQGTTDALILGVVALLANSVLQQLIQPFVMGATLGLNPLVVLVVTIGAGALFGMVGLTLAAPLTSAAVHISNELRDRSGRSAGAEPAAAPSG